MEDSELEAMRSVLAALQPLDGPEQVRVLRWAWQRFGDETDTPAGAPTTANVPDVPSEFTDPAHVIEASGASTGPERALCVAFFVQEIEGRPNFASQEINTVLKNLGHPLANVTKTLSSLRAQRPPLVMQVSKSGRTQQARKTYRLTNAGLDRVREMVSRGQKEANGR